ncbi:MAG: ABC transporter permease [Lachnospiraceae bacterium]|nr:ABC transporter permease [Lachnospiraceae bacterium]MEE3460948.1 ABC transporter permease [Lachnospiraceae bacterium]
MNDNTIKRADSIHFSRSFLSIPYIIFLAVFVVLPLLVVLYYAFTNGSGQFTVRHFVNFFTNDRTVGTLFYSLFVAVIVTLFCLLLAYPTAYILAKSDFKHKGLLLIILVVPMWINFTLRLTAMKEILDAIEGNLAYYSFFNTILCMTYDFLPFMILPIYNSLSKLDDSMVEAARDLGASGRQAMFRVIIPMSMPGIVSGITMVFLPAMTNYVVLDMVYNSTFIMGSLIGSYFSAYDWHAGSMVSVILLALIFVISALENRVTGSNERE